MTDPVLVSPEEFARSFRPPGALAVRARVAGSDVATVARVTRRAVTHDRTRTGAKLVARNVAYVPLGVVVWFRYFREHFTSARYDREIDAARSNGNSELVLELIARQEADRERRHKRIMAYLRAPQELVKAGIWLLSCLVGLLLAAGGLLFLVTGDGASIVAPIRAVMFALAWLVWAFTMFGTQILVGVPLAILGGLWWAGRRAPSRLEWLEAPGNTRDETIDPQVVTTALAHLGIPAMNRAIRDGWRVEFKLPPTLVNGRGYQTVFSIPMGVTAGMIADKRDVLARNLMRAPLEVWPAAYRDAGWVETWVAHPGATERSGATYPLLHDGTVDVFTGVPIGESQRGDLITVPLMEASMGVGGLPGQGKSNAVRVIMAGAALDPLADLRVYVFAGNGDFDAFAPRLSRYRRGVDDSVITDAVAELRELYREVERREGRLAEVGAKKLSRSLAAKHADLRPIVVAFSECHEMYGHPDLGKEAADLSIAVVKRMRKCGIFMVFDTQSSRAAAIPSALVELFKYNACFAVKTWRSNDGFLGDGSFQAGIRATELRPGKDRGTSLLTGASEERFELLDWFYLEADDDTGYDAATDIIARSMRKAKVVPSSVAHDEPRDLLEDVYELMGDDDRMRASELAVMLRRVDAGYQNLDGVRLAEMLAEHGVRVRTHKGFPKVVAAEVQAAMGERVGGR